MDPKKIFKVKFVGRGGYPFRFTSVVKAVVWVDPCVAAVGYALTGLEVIGQSSRPPCRRGLLSIVEAAKWPMISVGNRGTAMI